MRKSKRMLKMYTKDETKRIMDVFSHNPDRNTKKELADELGRSVTVLNQKYWYERKMKKARRKPYTKRSRNIIAKFNTPPVTSIKTIKPATILIGDNIKIEIPTNSFNINGVKVDW